MRPEAVKGSVSKGAEGKYFRGQDVAVALQHDEEAQLVKSLTALRNQLTVKYEEIVPVSDERIVLVQAWLEISTGASDVFRIWQRCTMRQQVLVSAIVSLLSTTLTLLSTHYSLHVLATPIITSLLSSQWLPKLNGYLASGHRDLILFTLKLFNCLSSYGGGQERKHLLEGFAWDSKALVKLLSMRRRGGEIKSILAVPDIRSLFILFILSFLDKSTPPALKASFLEQRRDTITSVFKGLADDPYPLAHKVLEVALFQESSLVHIMKLYERAAPEGPDADDVPAALGHHFLLAICTVPGVGVCFRDRGWYHRDTDGVDHISNRKGSGNVYNRILGNILNGLKVNEDLRQQELALRILHACPELVAGYWSGSSLTLEPRLSSKWIANISFLGSVVSQPVPESTFRLPESPQLFNPSPPAIATIIENILPLASIKTHFSRGLQSPSALVQHCTALALIKCLTKYHTVLETFKLVEHALEENENGRWSARRAELEREVRRRVPDLQVVLAFAQQKGHDILQTATTPVDNSAAPQANHARKALLLESAQRVLWLYHRLVPSLVSEARFDVGKLLQTTYAAESVKTSSVTAGVDTLRHLHVLRLLQVSDQFSWSAKTGSHSNFGIMLRFYSDTRSSAIKSAIQTLLEASLSGSLLFQHDPEEVSLWLESLSTSRSGPISDVKDVISFLDDCAQRYHKTPYRYIEEQQKLLAAPIEEGHDDDMVVSRGSSAETSPSPLLIVLIEQICARVKIQSGDDAGLQLILQFICKLLVRLASKVPSLSTMRLFLVHLQSGLHSVTSLNSAVIKEELDILAREFARIEGHPADQAMQQTVSENIDSGYFLDKFVAASDEDIARSDLRESLVTAIRSTRITAFKRCFTLVNHRLLGYTQRDKTRGDLLLLASSVVREAKTSLVRDHIDALKEFILQLTAVKQISASVLQAQSRHGFASLLGQLFDEGDDQDKSLVAERTIYWIQAFTNGDSSSDQIPTALLWLRYMNAERVWVFVDALTSGRLPANLLSTNALANVLQVVLLNALSQGAATKDGGRLEQLVRLQSVFPASQSLEPIIALATGNHVPPIYPSGLSWHTSDKSITEILGAPRMRINIRSEFQGNAVDIGPFLSSPRWTSHTARIIVNLLYLQPSVRHQVVSWLQDNAETCPEEYLASLLIALIDSTASPEDLISGDGRYLLTACSRLLKTVHKSSIWQTTKASTACICQVIRNIPSLQSELLVILVKQCRSLKQGAITLGILEVAKTAQTCYGDDAKDFVATIVDHAWTWAVDVLAQKELGEDVNEMLDCLSALCSNSSNLKSHLIEPVVTVAIQHQLSHSKVLDFVRHVIAKAAFKPASVNKHLQSVIQHPQLYELCGSNGHHDAKLSIITFLHTLFHLHPSNTCQPSHILPLSPLYNGTLSAFDRKLLSIFQLYETTRKVSAAPLLFARGSPADDAKALSLIQRLDPNAVFRTCASFPQWRKLEGGDEDVLDVDEALCDPVYAVLIFAQFLLEKVSVSALTWVQAFRTNVVALLIRTVSAEDVPLRELALSQIAGLHKRLEDTDMVEKPHVLHILNLLKDQYRHDPTRTSLARLPAYTTLHLSHSLRNVYYPSQFTYPMTARYLLQRPELDVSDVPMLYTTLYSADDQWKRDRAWMMRFLGDGMVGKEEWKVLRRRHTWDLVASQFQGTGDRAFRIGALKFLANITCKPFTITQLILKSSLLIWLEAQLQDLKPGEDIAWLKIMENIVVLADAPKLDAATNGEWCLALGRCILAILKRNGGLAIETLHLALQLTLRLTLLAPTNPHLPPLISAFLTHLSSTSSSLPSISSGSTTRPPLPPSTPPHSGHHLFRIPEDGHTTWWYGQCVELLWRISMGLPSPPSQWEELTYMLLVWRQVIGEEGSVIGEWARKEVLRNLIA